MALENLLREDIVIDFPPDNEYVLTSSEIQLGLSGFTYSYDQMRSNYSPEASRLFQWFRSLHSTCNRSNCEETIIAMLRIFRKYKHILSLALREYILIEGIVELCYRHQIENSILIDQVLDEIYRTWSSFGPLHLAAIFKTTIFANSYDQKKSRNVLTYFLEHARLLKKEYNGIRMIDVSIYCSIFKTPIFAAAESWCWRSVLKYLQYGASFEDVRIDPVISRHGVTSAMIDLFRTFICHLWTELIEPLEVCNTERETEEFITNLPLDMSEMWKTFSVILRAVLCIQLPELCFVMLHRRDQFIEEIFSYRVLVHQVTGIILPTLLVRYARVQPLQHSCRYAIRKRLNENWQLPNGIDSLPLPNILKKYLNLLID